MRYFTRELHDEQQDDVGVEESQLERDERLVAASMKWKAANLAYLEYLKTVRNSFPIALNELVDICLHDCVIMSITCEDSNVELLLDTTNALFKLANKVMRLRFVNVTYATGLDVAVGQAIIHEEYHLQKSLFEYCALLEKTEILIRFSHLD